MLVDFEKLNPLEKSNEQNDQSVNDAAPQTLLDNDHQSSLTTLTPVSEKSNEIRQKVLARWDDCLNKKLGPQQRAPITDKSIAQPSTEKIVVTEFLPRTVDDPVLAILRRLFVQSFNQYYQEIEEKLKLETNTTLIQWLDETFNETQQAMLQRQTRCFMLCSLDDEVENEKNQGIIGFLIVKEEADGSIYIAQCAIDAQSKRCGHGSRLIRHLGSIYPPNTYYCGLCRRANEPAVKFYLKQGAKIMDDKEVATKYKYDPQLYAGFHFTDQTDNIPRKVSGSNVSTAAPESSRKSTSTDSIAERRLQVVYQDNSTMTEPSLIIKKKRRLPKQEHCCSIS